VYHNFELFFDKVENILKVSLDSIPSPSPSVKIQIMGGKVCLRFKGKPLLGVVNKILKKKGFYPLPPHLVHVVIVWPFIEIMV
jgi:hypothetical protein